MDASLISRMKELEDKNRRLKKLSVDAQLSAELLREELVKMVAPAHRRALAHGAVQTARTTIRHFATSETCYRHEGAQTREDAAVEDYLLRLTTTHRMWRFRLCLLNLRNVQRLERNHKRVYRVYRALEINLRVSPSVAWCGRCHISTEAGHGSGGARIVDLPAGVSMPSWGEHRGTSCYATGRARAARRSRFLSIQSQLRTRPNYDVGRCSAGPFTLNLTRPEVTSPCPTNLLPPSSSL